MRFFNVAGPCNPEDHYMLPATAPSSRRTRSVVAETPAGRAMMVMRA